MEVATSSSGAFGALPSTSQPPASTLVFIPPPKPVSNGASPMDDAKSESSKEILILEACRAKNYQALASLATSHSGFLNDEVRRKAWPVLLGAAVAPQENAPWAALPAHRDEEQVKLDVNRAFVYYPNDQSDQQLEKRKQELSNLITEVLRRHPSLSYFQGYHDIAQVLLLVLGAEHAAPALAHLSLLRIRDFMLPSLAGAITHLQLLPPILYSADPTLARHLEGTQPFFALSATLTLYAHDIQEYGAIGRLFDFLIAREAVISVYLFAVIILRRKDELLQIPIDEPEMLHFTLSKLPQPLHIEQIVEQTTKLYEQYPPEILPNGAWRKVSAYSVLKTTRNSSQVAQQSLNEGEQLLQKHAAQVARREKIQKALQKAKKLGWAYRRPARFAAVAVAVAILSWWLGRNNRTPSHYFLVLRRPFEALAEFCFG